MGVNYSIINLTDSIQKGDFSLISDMLPDIKSDFIIRMKREFEMNSFQAENLYKKTKLSFISCLLDREVIFPNMEIPELFKKTGERIFKEYFASDENISEKTYLSKIEIEIKKLEAVPAKIKEAQKKLDDKCKKLIILIYYAKFPLSKTMNLMGLKTLEELEKLLGECKPKVNEYLP